MSGDQAADPAARLHAFVDGRVQGVFFRASTQRRAVELGLHGWVRNCADGRVEVVAEGPRPACEALLAYCREGPPAAGVETVEHRWLPASGEFERFLVTR